MCNKVHSLPPFFVPFGCNHSCGPRSSAVTPNFDFGLFNVPADSDPNFRDFMGSLVAELGALSATIAMPNYNNTFSSSSVSSSTGSVLDSDGHYKPDGIKPNPYEKFSEAGIKDKIDELRKKEKAILALKEQIDKNPSNKEELQAQMQTLVDALEDLEYEYFGSYDVRPSSRDGKAFYTNLSDAEIASIADQNKKIASKQARLDSIGKKIDEITAEMKADYDRLVSLQQKASPEEERAKKRNEARIAKLKKDAGAIIREMNADITKIGKYVADAAKDDKTADYNGATPSTSATSSTKFKDALFKGGKLTDKLDEDTISSLRKTGALEYYEDVIDGDAIQKFYEKLETQLGSRCNPERFDDLFKDLLAKPDELKKIFGDSKNISNELRILKALCEKAGLQENFKKIDISKLLDFGNLKEDAFLDILSVVDKDMCKGISDVLRENPDMWKGISAVLKANPDMWKGISAVFKNEKATHESKTKILKLFSDTDRINKLNDTLDLIVKDMNLAKLLKDFKGDIYHLVKVLSELEKDDFTAITELCWNDNPSADRQGKELNHSFLTYKFGTGDGAKNKPARKLLYLLIKHDIIEQAEPTDAIEDSFTYHYGSKDDGDDKIKILWTLVNPQTGSEGRTNEITDALLKEHDFAFE